MANTKRCPLCGLFVGPYAKSNLIHSFNKLWHYKCLTMFKRAAKVLFT